MEPERGAEFTHTGGRHCTWNGRSWRYGSSGQFVCMAGPHGYTDDKDRPYDRGEFGMPGIGGGDIITHTPEWQAAPARVFVEPRQAGKNKVFRVLGILKEAEDLYRRKASRYEHGGGDTADVLGAKGQFADINRKFWVLKGMLWDETISPYPDKGEGESVEEVLMDFIGHAALTIDFLRQSQGNKEEGHA